MQVARTAATLSTMSWLGRLLGRAPAAPPLPATAVVVPEDVAARLTSGGAPLADAVETALREYLAAQERVEAQAAAGGDKPFWLTRDDERSGDLEERLRDRIAQRRAGEGEAER